MKNFFYLTIILLFSNINISYAGIDLSDTINQISANIKSQKVQNIQDKFTNMGGKYKQITQRIENDIKKIIKKFDNIKDVINDNLLEIKQKLAEFDKIKQDSKKYLTWFIYTLIAFFIIFILLAIISILLICSNRNIKKELAEIKKILQQ